MKQSNEHWFQWEREATVQPILMCMEAWMKPMKKVYGRPWPTTVLIYNGDLVGWYNLWSELLDYGQYLINKFIKREERKQLENEVKEKALQLEVMFKKFDSIEVSKVSNEKLLELYHELYTNWIAWFVPGGLVEPIGHQGEKILQRRLKGNPKASEIISVITTTTRESFSKRELKALLRIAIAKNNGNDIGQMLKEHAVQYYWIHNNYFSTEVLGPDFFENELKIIQKKYPEPENQLEQMEKELASVRREKERLMDELNFDSQDRELVELLDLFAWYQDYRKEYIMRLLHYLDSVLSEIGRRKNLTLKEMKYFLSDEVPKVLSCKFDIAVSHERMKRCLFYWDQHNEQFIHGTGQFSLDKEKEIFHSLKHESNIMEVNGMVANKGIIRGRAYVTMSAKEAEGLGKGDVLITSMTTPDFVTSMKRAAAIVTNEGGILSHAAVMSREFGIPCIVGTRIATKVFKTGDIVEVDGDLGVVRKISDNSGVV